MSGEVALRGVMIAALRGDAGLMALINRVEESGAPKVSAPALVLGQFIASEWGARGIRGLGVRVPLTLIDRADRPDRLGAAAARVEVVMGSLPRQVEDWSIGVVRFGQSRTVRGGDGLWTMLVDYQVRLSRLL
jgi:hypothetical protein